MGNPLISYNLRLHPAKRGKIQVLIYQLLKKVDADALKDLIYSLF
jgi:hypothetical protein